MAHSRCIELTTPSCNCQPNHSTNWIAIAAALLVMSLGVTTDLNAEETRYFSIKMKGRLIGYSRVNREVLDSDASKTNLISDTLLKVAMMGKERVTRLQSETVIDSATGSPTAYRMSGTTNDVVQRVESDFDKVNVETWIFRAGDERGDSVKAEFSPKTVLLGSNNFAHWQMLIDAVVDQAVENRSQVSVYLPDAQQTEQFDFERSDTTTISIAGRKRQCVEWELSKTQMSAFVDSNTNELLRLDLQGQGIIVEKADATVVKQTQKATAEEVLARHFTQSNVLFSDFLDVRTLVADIDVKVIGTGLAATPSTLNTAMQRFEGTKEDDRIRGIVSIETRPYRAQSSPTFPTGKISQEMESWTKAAAYIESDHGPIVEQAAVLTRDAKSRWDAVKRIGEWVNQEISYTIADTPSARLAFEKRRGDCGPHSTLMVAMLRASEIPARLVGGLVYTPSFGGSFGQHAWVEVSMGPDGWIAVDPTTGEFDELSATHIKLFEGMGGVLPTSIEVQSFEPSSAGMDPDSLADRKFPVAKPLSWELGKTYKFLYKQGGKELGTETFTIESGDQAGTPTYTVSTDVQLKLNLITTVTTKTELIVEQNAKPISFTQQASALLQNVKIECTFKDAIVEQKISGTKNLTREISLAPRSYCFDNNLMSSWVTICSQLPIEVGKSITVNTYHPSTMQTIPLTFTPQELKPLEVAGETLNCFVCDVAPIKNTFWISEDGRFVKVTQGNLEIKLVK